MDVTFVIPDQHVSRVLDAFDGQYEGREDYSRADWAKKHVAAFIKAIVTKHEVQNAVDDARAQAIEDAAQVDITYG